MKLFEFIDLNHLSTNPKGSTYTLPQVNNSGMILASRHKGSLSGNHWHKGEVSGKNPEHLLLLKGKMRITGRHLITEKTEEHEVEAPLLIKTFPQVLHTFEALSDCQFLEFNSIEEHKQDTYYPDTN